MTTLEDRYRSLLRLLPATYRATWEDEMVATFLDTTRPDDPEDADFVAAFGRPGWSERASVAALAVRLRLGGVEAPPRSYAWGEAVRLVALGSLLAHVVLAAMGAWQTLWLSGSIPWPPVPAAVTTLILDAPPGDAWRVAGDATGFLWLGAYLAVVLGHRRTAQALAAVALLAVVTAATATTFQLVPGWGTPLVLTLWTDVIVTVLTVAALSAFHRDAPPRRARPWLAALCAGVLVAPILGWAAAVQPPDTPRWDWPALASTAVVVAGVVVHLAARDRGGPPGTLALALLAAAVLALRVVSLVEYAVVAAPGPDLPTLALGGAEAVAVVAVGTRLWVLAQRDLRGLRSRPETLVG